MENVVSSPVALIVAAMFKYIGLDIDHEFIDIYLSWASMLLSLTSVIVFSFVFLLRKAVQIVDKNDGDKLLWLSCSFAIVNALVVLVVFATYGTGRSITGLGTIESPMEMLRNTLIFINSTVYIFHALSLLVFYTFTRKKIKKKSEFKYDLIVLLAIILLIWTTNLTYLPDYTVFLMARNSLFVINSFVCFVQIFVFFLFYILAKNHDIEYKNNLNHDQLALFSTVFLIGASCLAYLSGYTDRNLSADTVNVIIIYHNYLLLAYVLYVLWGFCAWRCFIKLYNNVKYF